MTRDEKVTVPRKALDELIEGLKKILRTIHEEEPSN